MIKMEINYDKTDEIINMGVSLKKEEYEAVQNVLNGRFEEVYREYTKGLMERGGGPKIVINNGHIKKLDLGNDLRILYPVLSDLNLKTLHPDIGKLQYLESLNVSRHSLETIPDSIGNLDSLINLELCNNQISVLPESIGKLSKLKNLYARFNRIPNLPSTIVNLESLECLLLDCNKLEALPFGLDNLKKLEQLSIADNEIESIPYDLEQLGYLRTIGVAGNPLDKESITRLKRLQNKKVSGGIGRGIVKVEVYGLNKLKKLVSSKE